MAQSPVSDVGQKIHAAKVVYLCEMERNFLEKPYFCIPFSRADESSDYQIV
jgi:hypothetical protein